MFQKPKTAKRMHFDVIPRAMDEYHQQLRAFPTQTPDQQAANPVFHIHGHDVPASDMVVPFTMLLNLASVANAEEKSQMWGFMQRYAPEATPETHPGLDAAVGYAVAYYNDFVKPEKTFRAPTDVDRAALIYLKAALSSPEAALAKIAKKNKMMGKDEALPEANMTDGDFLQSIVFAVGKNHGFDNLRDWFKALYEVLLGASQGPRFGGFMALYGVSESIALIDQGLNGELS